MGFGFEDLTDVAKLQQSQIQLAEVALQENQEKQNLDIKYVGSKGLNYLAAKFESSPVFLQNSDNKMGFKIVDQVSP